MKRRIASVIVAAGLLAVVASGCRRRNRAETGSADPRDEAFAGFVNNAAAAILASARGMPHDPRWDGFVPSHDLRAINPSNLTTVAALGPSPQVVATAVEVEGVQQGLGSGAYLRSNVLVFPDGRVRWMSVSVRPSAPSVVPIDRNVLGTLAPALGAEFDRTLQAVSGPCNLPMLAPTEVAVFPPSDQAGALREVGGQPLACAVARTVPNTGGLWQPRLDDITVIVRGNNLWATIRSEFGFEGGRLSLRAPRVRTPVAQ